MAQPWRIHFFQRHKQNDPNRSIPAFDFFEEIPEEVAAKMHAVLEAVAEAPPPSFGGGGMWEAMKGDMAGMYEVRTQMGERNYRLFCVLERDAADLGGSSTVCIDGLSKPKRAAAAPKEYRRVRKLRDEFKKRRTVWEGD